MATDEGDTEFDSDPDVIEQDFLDIFNRKLDKQMERGYDVIEAMNRVTLKMRKRAHAKNPNWPPKRKRRKISTRTFEEREADPYASAFESDDDSDDEEEEEEEEQVEVEQEQVQVPDLARPHRRNFKAHRSSTPSQKLMKVNVVKQEIVAATLIKNEDDDEEDDGSVKNLVIDESYEPEE